MHEPSRRKSASGAVVCLAFSLLSQVSLAGERSPLHARVLATAFERVSRVDALPAPVLAALSPLLGGRRLLDPVYLDGATNMWKPNTEDRLLLAGKSPALWLVHYELQGQPATRHVAIVELEGQNRAALREHLLVKEQAFSVPALKNMVRNRQFTMAADAASSGARP